MIDEVKPNLDGSGLQIGVVVARFNEYAGREEWAACLDELKKLGVAEDDITHVTVPGALEIPLTLAKLAATDEYDALIALGAVIKGETYHFEIVSNESSAGITRVALDYDIPIANGILTTYDDDQCKARTDMKGRDCARCAVEMANLCNQYPSDADLMDFEEDD